MYECFIFVNLDGYYTTSEYSSPIPQLPSKLAYCLDCSSCVSLPLHTSPLDLKQASCHSTANCVYHLAFSDSLFLPLFPSVPCWFHSGMTHKVSWSSTDSCSFFFLISLFIYLFLAVLGLCCCAQAFSSCGKQGLVFIAVHGFLIAVSSLCCRAWVIGTWASVVVARGLSSCGSRAPEHRLSSCGARAPEHRLSSCGARA